MIYFKDGDIFKDTSEAIVNAVNCVGVMGKGIALKFKEKYPNNYTMYKTACNRKEVKIGKMFIYKESNKTIINFPTKEHWRNDSKIEYIEEGLKDLVKTLQSLNIESVAMPAIGCGNGGLSWDVIKKTIKEYLSDVDMNIIVYNPVDIKENKGEKMSVNYLVIPESPAKSRTIASFLGSEYAVKASFGHIRGIKKSYDFKNVLASGCNPEYENDKEKLKVIRELRDYINKDTIVYLATDEDREG